MCKGWIEVLAEVQIKTEANVSFVVPASSPLEVPALPKTESHFSVADDPSHVKDESAIDEQMSDEPADVPISEPGAQADQHLDSHPSLAPLLATKFSGNLVLFVQFPNYENNWNCAVSRLIQKNKKSA